MNNARVPLLCCRRASALVLLVLPAAVALSGTTSPIRAVVQKVQARSLLRNDLRDTLLKMG